jgi:hypothetical protein
MSHLHADLEFIPHYFPYLYEDLEHLIDQPLAAEDETDAHMAMIAAESMIEDWHGEHDDLEAEHERLGTSLPLDDLSHIRSCADFNETDDFLTSHGVRGVPSSSSISGTDGSSPSNAMSPMSSRAFLAPSSSPALGIAVAR